MSRYRHALPTACPATLNFMPLSPRYIINYLLIKDTYTHIYYLFSLSFFFFYPALSSVKKEIIKEIQKYNTILIQKFSLTKLNI